MRRGVTIPRPYCRCCGVRYVAVQYCATGVRFESRCRRCIEENQRVRSEQEIRVGLAAQLEAIHDRWAGILLSDLAALEREG